LIRLFYTIPPRTVWVPSVTPNSSLGRCGSSVFLFAGFPLLLQGFATCGQNCNSWLFPQCGQTPPPPLFFDPPLGSFKPPPFFCFSVCVPLFGSNPPPTTQYFGPSIFTTVLFFSQVSCVSPWPRRFVVPMGSPCLPRQLCFVFFLFRLLGFCPPNPPPPLFFFFFLVPLFELGVLPTPSLFFFTFLCSCVLFFCGKTLLAPLWTNFLEPLHPYAPQPPTFKPKISRFLRLKPFFVFFFNCGGSSWVFHFVFFFWFCIWFFFNFCLLFEPTGTWATCWSAPGGCTFFSIHPSRDRCNFPPPLFFFTPLFLL